jgi:hypothetical protein
VGSTVMTTYPRSGPTERFCPSPCPICSGPALELYVAVHKLHFECSHCGSFGITVAAKSAMGKRSRREREAWLTQARHYLTRHNDVALIDRTNEP